jgi:hypothetical protein
MTAGGSSDALAEDPFSYRVTKQGRVFIDRGGRTVTVVAGTDAKALTAKLDGAGPDVVQQLLARATGNYRRGSSWKRG